MWMGMHGIVTERIQGTMLADMESIPQPVATAAMRALKRVHSLCPGLCHGDVRLENIMLVQRDQQDQQDQEDQQDQQDQEDQQDQQDQKDQKDPQDQQDQQDQEDQEVCG